MFDRSHSNGGAYDVVLRFCGETTTCTSVRSQSSFALTTSWKFFFTTVSALGEVICTVGGTVSFMQPNAHGLGPPGQAPRVPFIIWYEFWLARSQRSPSIGRSSSTNPSQLEQMLGYMMSVSLA